MQALASVFLPLGAWRRLYQTPLMIIVDGNIGSGKTTLIRELARRLSRGREVLVLEERVSEWMKLDLLQAQYDQGLPARVRSIATACFQVLGPLCDGFERMHQIRSRASAPQIILQERCLEASSEVFLKACADERYEASKLDRDHADRLGALLKRIAPATPAPPATALRVCLEADADLCKRRVQQRDRESEGGLSTSDLALLETLYRSFWDAKEREGKERICRVDASLPIDRICDAVEAHVSL